MGSGYSLPNNESEELVAKTHFKKYDLERWYKRFMKQFPRGGMTEEEFFSIYGTLFTDTFCSTIAKHIFGSFDTNKDGVISFQELMTTLSMTIKGTNEEKVEWLFNVYDFDGNGKISMEEFQNITSVIQKALQHPKEEDTVVEEDEGEGGSAVDDYIQVVFDDVDADDNGYWTLDEFAQGVKSHPGLVNLLVVDKPKDN